MATTEIDPEIPPFVSPDSFEANVEDLQDIKDIQQFYKRDWETNSTINFQTGFKNDQTDVKFGLGYNIKEDKFKESLKLTTTKLGNNKKLQFKLDQESASLHLDNGHTRLHKLNFNPYYKLKLSTAQGSSNLFKSFTIGLNHHNSKFYCTHNEFEIRRKGSELRLHFLNNLCSSFWKLKYSMLTLLKYGSKVEKDSKISLSLPLFNNSFVPYLIYLDSSKTEPEFFVGSKLSPNKNLDLFCCTSNLKTLQEDNFDPRPALGFKIHTEKGINAKFMATKLNVFNAYIQYVHENTKASLALMADFSDKNKKDLDWGFKIEHNW